MIKTAIAAAALGILAFAAPAALAQQASATRSANVALAGADRDAALTRANRSLNGAQRLQGRFTQTAPDGEEACAVCHAEGREVAISTAHSGRN